MKVKQISIQKISVVRHAGTAAAVLCALCISARADQAQDRAKSFGGDVAKVRLAGRSELDHGSYRTAVIITMPSGWHTYWKEPGDAGVPPVFAFGGSVNLAKSEILFPVPMRLKEDGLEAFGYSEHVAFPIVVTPTDPAKPVTLHLDLNYAVCNKICVPGHAAADLALPVPPSGADDATVAGAFAAIPVALPAEQASELSLIPLAGAAKPSWTVSWSGKAPVTDIFAQAPEGYAFDTRQGERPGTWMLIASQTAEDARNALVPVALTLAGTRQSYETVRTLRIPTNSGKP